MAKKDIHEILIEMADIADKAGYCGSLYQTNDETLAVVCMKPVPRHGEECNNCDQRNEAWSNGDYRGFDLIREKEARYRNHRKMPEVSSNQKTLNRRDCN